MVHFTTVMMLVVETLRVGGKEGREKMKGVRSLTKVRIDNPFLR